MLAKGPSLPADEVFMDLEDSVAPAAKEEARANIVLALKEGDWSGKTAVVRVNGVPTKWCYRDVIEVVEGAGEHIDCLMIPKVEYVTDVTFVDDLLRMVEDTIGLNRRIGLELQIETATGLTNIDEIAQVSDRAETLIFGPADMSASLGLPTVTAGLPMPGYPGDHWHHVLMTILIAARNASLQAIDGPYLVIKDLDGFREMALRARALGYDGKWALHPGPDRRPERGLHAHSGRVRQGRGDPRGVRACHRRRADGRGDVRHRDDRRGQPQDGRAARHARQGRRHAEGKVT